MSKPAPKRKLKDAFTLIFAEICNEFTPQFREMFRQGVWPIVTRASWWEDELTEEEYRKNLTQMRREIPRVIRNFLRPKIPSGYWIVDKN